MMETGSLVYREIQVSDLKPFVVRDIRSQIVEILSGRIKNCFNPARPLSVVEQNGKYLVADGNHRLEAVKRSGLNKIPCIVYPEGTDPYRLAVECNADEDVYAPFDLFDWLSILEKLRDEGSSQEEIGEKIGWSRGQVGNYFMLLNSIVTEVLDFAKSVQKGRVTEIVTDVTKSESKNKVEFDFTEGWFRTSGIYDLCEKYQIDFIKRFITDKCSWNKEKIQKEVAKYKMWQSFLRKAKEELHNPDDYEVIESLVNNDVFKSERQFLSKISDLNQKAKNKLICGDCLIELEKLEDASIDLVITDPPYGIDYSSNYSKYNDFITKTKICNDNEKAFDLLDKVCEILTRKTKPDAHLYIFTSWKTYPEFYFVVSKYFTVKNLLVWDKGNHSMGDLERAWGNRYELIVFATKEDKKVNIRKPDIISVPRMVQEKMIHPTQKPVNLIKVLLEVSANKADSVCDPFMGSGSVIKAVKEFGDLNYIGIEIDPVFFEKAVSFIGYKDDVK